MDAEMLLAEKPRSRLVVAALGVVSPGLGHAFLGYPLRGVLWALAPFIAVGLLLGLTHDQGMTAVLGLAAIVALAWVGSLIDGQIVARKESRPLSVPGIVALVLVPVLVAPLLAVLLRVFVVEAFKVPSGAMIPTIAIGDHLFVDKRTYGSRAPRRGEVFVFRYPEHPEQDFIKRAIAVEGDTLDVQAGHPRINGWQVPSCKVGAWSYVETADGSRHAGELYVEFLEASAYLVFFDASGLTADYQGPFHVAAGETWVLGDNRNNSHDSRFWHGGAGGGVARELVKGAARTIWMSPQSNHKGLDLAGDPVAPSPELAAPLAACVAKRPSLEKATPPAPGAPAH